MKNKILWLAWIPAILVMLMIFLFSTENGIQSSGLSGSVTETVVDAVIDAADLEITPLEKENIIEKIHTPIRKFGHLSEYALLGMTVTFALFVCHGQRGRRAYLIGETICILNAAADELHQLLVPGRSGMITDVGIDAIGAFAGILFFICILKIKRHFKKNSH